MKGYRTAAAHGIDIDQRLGVTLELVEKLTETPKWWSN